MTSLTLERTATPGIYKRGGRYVVTYRDNGGKQRKRFARTLAEARRLKRGLSTDVDRGEYRESSRLTLAEYAAEWIETYTGRRKKRSIGAVTRADYRGALDREIIPALGHLRLTAIEARDVKRLAADLGKRGLAQGSVDKTIAPLRALLATAHEEGLIRSNPAAGVVAQIVRDELNENDEIDANDEQVKALTDEERTRLLERIDPTRRPFFEFLFETGLRISEAIEVRHRDVDGEWLRIDRRYYRGRLGLPKGGKRRRVRLSQPMAQTLWTMRRDAKPDDLLFTSAKGARIDPSNLMARVLKPAAVACGLGEIVKGTPTSWVGFHTFRHSCATALFRGVWNETTERYEGGWNAVQVQKFLGHADPGFTLRTYVHLLPEDLPEPDFGLGVGNKWATEEAEIDSAEPSGALAGMAV